MRRPASRVGRFFFFSHNQFVQKVQEAMADSLRVLIADDETLHNLALTSQLETLGHEVIATATNGREAVELARQTQPDIAFLDIRMPQMSGPEAALQIATDRPIPMIVLSAYSDSRTVEEAIKAVPSGAERLNMDQDALGEPLKDMKVYEPCKPGTAHAKIRVAVWEGKAVGVDVETTPKNQKLAECINQQIRQLTWKDSVPSLNTIEFGF